jgi:hypothetical protein
MHRVAIPEHVHELHLFGDNDDAGRDAVKRAAYENRARRVVLRFPPENCKDWNDFAKLFGSSIPHSGDLR